MAVTTTVTAASVSVSTSTVLSTITAPPNPATVDQNGCSAIEGNNDGNGFIYNCGINFGPGSFSMGTIPGLNVEDCASQCFLNALGGGCLSASYTPASPPYNFMGSLQPGTCTLYSFPSGRVAVGAMAVAAFQGF